jgi:hypothetical protein
MNPIELTRRQATPLLSAVAALLLLAACTQAPGIVGRWQGADGQVTEFTRDGQMITGTTSSSYELNADTNEIAVSSGGAGITYKFVIEGNQLTLTVVQMAGRTIPEGDGMRLQFTRVR